MDEQRAREDIKLIRDMLERTRKATAESGTLFIFWGIWMILAISCMYGLVFLHREDLIWLNWTVFGVIGWIYTAVNRIRQGRVQRTRTYLQTAVGYVSIACAIGYVLAAFAFPLLKVYSYEVISAVIALISGIGLFTLGGLFRMPLLLWSGVLWWLGAIGMAFIPGDWRGLGLVPLMIVGYLVPGLSFRIRFRRNGGEKAA